MGWFFIKAALLWTFGGAYAVLPYGFIKGAVSHHGWLTPTQMIDGLALGETTPGPITCKGSSCVICWGHVQTSAGAEHLFWPVRSQRLVTWFTLPSFLFIRRGPLVESDP